MALHKLSKTYQKSLRCDYLGCTAAVALINEQFIREAIEFVRQAKSTHGTVKTVIYTSNEGVRILYENEQKYTTLVPNTMVAGCAIGKHPFNDTVGCVYISPLSGYHYPAFVHVYRCESNRIAQKLLLRLKQYISNSVHRNRVLTLEKRLLKLNLLNTDRLITASSNDTTILSQDLFNNQTETSNTTSNHYNRSNNSGSNSYRVETENNNNENNPIKSITEEFQKKIDKNQPILFPPKDYDTMRRVHGHIERADEWRSREPTIVGFSSINSDENRVQRQIEPLNSNKMMVNDNNNQKQSFQNEPRTNGRSLSSISSTNSTGDRQRSLTQRSDLTADPVETVSLAFDFLKDETGSIFSDGDLENEPITNNINNRPVFRFRPPDITSTNKKLSIGRGQASFNVVPEHENNVGSTDDLKASATEFSAYHRDSNNGRNAHAQVDEQYRRQPPPNVSKSTTAQSNSPARAKSETRLHQQQINGQQQQRSNGLIGPRYENRVVHTGQPSSMNPVWTGPTPQSNIALLSTSSSNMIQQNTNNIHELSSSSERRNPDMPVHPLYSSYPQSGYKASVIDDYSSGRLSKGNVVDNNNNNHLNRHVTNGNGINSKKQATSSQLRTAAQFPTNEFILKSSNGNLLRNHVTPITREYRPHSLVVDPTIYNLSPQNPLDVYY
ncbi:unnamed protein product [Didymodactylos carnosus]|uniref:PID domain-containing protein n=1 Tax=Didymodactylos carnosus TaxID=1234261 RepID=A0A813RU46_9BILA|nr:unnamed protein product [Didymodactylos carnosus]CAF0927256.1 unnamed protein product [Didymodactylos carnosus]CAF3569741.1 unnamed protein product [Didymodactylos carnosus]CAF3704213.1 unnamed protein product [Didymodactylos carnosus]